MEKLENKLWKELDEIADKPDLSAGDLQTAHVLTDTIKNIKKICALDEGGYSKDGEWAADMRGTYGHGSSYANRGEHYVRGHYSRDGGMGKDYSGRRDSRGRYSRGDGTDEMMEYVRMAVETAPAEYKEAARRFMRELENA